MRDQEINEIIQELRGHLELQRGLGMEQFVSPPTVSLPSKSQSLPALREEIGDCQRCKLHSTRTHIVFGSGNPRARLMLIGEAPGREEDLQGQPFVGKAGQLLIRILKAMELEREDVYITNILKCRPPANRDPEPDEIAMCEPFLRKQVERINPIVICALGSFAARTLLQSNERISRMRGRFHDYFGIKLMPTYHPAYLLRNPQDKRLVWEDMKLIMEAIRE